MERQLQRLTWLQIRKLVPARIDTAILPVGTVEAHGATCVGTDNVIPESIAAGIAERIDALIAPVISYGITKSLYRYNGGITIKPDTFAAYVQDVVDSLADSGFKNVFVMNGHGGNNEALKQMAATCHREKRINIAVVHWWELCGDMTREFFGHAGGHGGTDETAMVMAADPQLVDEDAYDPEMAYLFNPGAVVLPVPGPIILYRKDEGYPVFDRDLANEYRDKVIATVGEFAETILARWRKWAL